MAGRVVCTGCGKGFGIPEAQSAKKLPACPACGGAMQWAAAPTAKRPTADATQASTLDLLLQSEARSPRPAPQPVIPLSLHYVDESAFNWVPWAVGGGAAMLLLFIGVAAYSFLRPTPAIEAATTTKPRALARSPGAAADKSDGASDGAAAVDEPAQTDEFAKPKLAATVSDVKTSAAKTPDGESVAAKTPAATTTPVDKKPAEPTAKESAAKRALADKEKKEKKPRVKMSVADLIDAVGDGVVHITVYDADKEPFATGSGLIIARHYVDKWVEPDVKVKDQTKPMKGDLWLVATNYHVIAGATSAKVRMRNGKVFEARGMATFNRERDLAILALDEAPDDLTILEPADESTFRQGEDVVAIGHPKGFDFTVSTGIISAIRGTGNLPEEIAESIEAPADQQWIQTTAAITNGNSGGPLLTMYGEVVGINTWIMNTTGNLAFASHIKHMVELSKKAVDIKADMKTVTMTAFSSAKPVEAPEKIGDRSDWLESGVHDELARSTKRALAINWRPATKGDYSTFQAISTMLTVAAVYRYNVDELKTIGESLRKREWDFAAEVEPINRYAVEYLRQENWGVMLFGTVRRINAASRRKMWIDLTGRGYTVAVTVPTNQPAPKLEIGDQILVFGYCIGSTPENSVLKREVDHILAGHLMKVKLPGVPEDTALQAAYDLIRHRRADQGFEENAREFNELYPRVIPMMGKTAVRWQRIDLNTRGRQFDAVRFSVPPELKSDMLWAFNDPDDAIEMWDVMPVGNFPLRQTDHSHTALQGFATPGLTKDESKRILLQTLDDGLIVPGEDYLLWFAFKDSKPRKVAIAVRLVPTESFQKSKMDSVRTVMRDGAAFPADVLVRMAKALKEKQASALAKGDEPATEPAAPTATDAPQDDPKDESKSEPKDETKDEPKDAPTEAPKDDATD